MAKVSGIEVVFTVNGINVPIGPELLADIVSALPDQDTYAAVFEQFAKSTAFSVRENVAYKDNINKNTVALLTKDPVEQVILNLVRSQNAAKFITDAVLLAIINRNSKLAAEIASRVEVFDKVNTTKTCLALISSIDPLVRKAVAENYNTPKKILTELLGDEEPEVVAAAKNSLENYM